MTTTTSPPIETAPELERRWWSRRRLLAALAVLLAALAVGLVVANPFGGSPKPGGGVVDNTSVTSLATVERRSISSQTQVSATLGYADPGTIAAPSGTAPSALMQAQQSLADANAQLRTAQATLASDERALGQAQAGLVADRRKLAVDCAGDNAGESSVTGGSGSAGSAASPCANDAQAMSADEQNLTQAADKVASDRRAAGLAATGVSSAETGLTESQAAATVGGQTSTYTALPAIGQVVTRGRTLYAVSGVPVLLLYGSTAPWRVFAAGMSPGRDVAELNGNLRALGYGPGLSGDAFTDATAAGIERFQTAHGLAATGRLLLGSVVFEPGAVRVTSVTPTLGAAVQPGAVLGFTSLRRQVTIELDAAQQADLKLGDPVVITLPDNSTTPGRVSYVGTVATAPSLADQGGGGGSNTPTVEVDVTPTDPGATGRLDQAPVNVAITTASVKDSLVVPVNALLALASGGYALEVVGAGGARHLVGIQLGLFDDADGAVQVTGQGLQAGERVVVPAE